jgi:uncharacterized membrane protein
MTLKPFARYRGRKACNWRMRKQQKIIGLGASISQPDPYIPMSANGSYFQQNVNIEWSYCMNMNKPMMAAALMALGMAAASGTLSAADEKVEMEKCSGIVKTGMNDCGANGHACAGQSKADNVAGEWVKVPKGTCEKITGGVVVAPAADKK